MFYKQLGGPNQQIWSQQRFGGVQHARVRRQLICPAKVEMHLPSFDGSGSPAKLPLQKFARAAIPLYFGGGKHRDREQDAVALVSEPIVHSDNPCSACSPSPAARNTRFI